MPDGIPFPERVWNDDLDGVLIRMFENSETMTGIANKLSRLGFPMSRSAVSGRIHRLRAMGKLPPVQPAPTAAEPVPAPPKEEPRARPGNAVFPRSRPRPEARVEAPPPAPVVEPAAEIVREVPPPDRVSPVTGAVLRLDDPWPSLACRFPIFAGTIDRDEPVFCGARVSRAPYCEAHRRLVYSPPSAGDRADRKDRGGNPSDRGIARHGPPISKTGSRRR